MIIVRHSSTVRYAQTVATHSNIRLLMYYACAGHAVIITEIDFFQFLMLLYSTYTAIIF